ncbi:hypothetical protein ACROYT_G004624 [Oculina patagonica]
MIFKRILIQAGETRRVDFLMERRSNTGQLAVAITSSQQFCLRQWKKYLLSGSNKVHLLRFLSEYRSKEEYAERIGSRKDKKRAFEMDRDSQVKSDSVQVIGESLTMSGQSITRLQEVVYMLYNDNRCKLVNDLRYKMFYKGKNVQSHQLPPTSAAFRYHLKRANYQVFLWKKALQPRFEQEPVSHGWKLKEGRLEIVWTDLAPSPQAVMEIVCCGCRGIRQTRRCVHVSVKACLSQRLVLALKIA